MARANNQYICQSCGARSTLWSGRCGSCGEWNSLVEEETIASGIAAGPETSSLHGKAVTLEPLDGEGEQLVRFSTFISELDRVSGGGLVPGSALLVGGDPGIGKSTLLLQAAAAVATGGKRVLYFSGEEATSQVRLHAKRLGLEKAPVELGAETNLANILATLTEGAPPDLVVIDSIQTLWSDQLSSAPGTVSQVRSCSQALVRATKQSGATLIIVGHVTKEGQIAGPKVIEHMVDTVLYFEGDKGHQYRILRAHKNRFGPTDEIGVFEMSGEGLKEVSNPSEIFLGGREENNPGSVVFAGIEGTRPVLVEIQALVAPSPLGTPRRAVVGWDNNRLSMILAVLEARCGCQFSHHDVYLNVAGGLRITEPAADFAAAAALVSSFNNVALSAHSIYFGEVSLSGAIRKVSHMGIRLKEAEKLGFTSAVMPSVDQEKKEGQQININEISHLSRFVLRLCQPESDAIISPHDEKMMPKQVK